MPRAAPPSQIAAATLSVLSRHAWHDVTMAQVAKAARMPLSRLLDIAPAKSALVGLLMRDLTRETAGLYRPGREAGAPRERLFDVAMTWFEVQERHRKSLESLYRGLRRDPLALVTLRGDLMTAAQWLLALAQADTGSLQPLRALAVAGIIARAVPAWLEDDKDLGKTMARLDGDLRRLERVLWPPDKRPAGKKRRPKAPA